MIIPVNVQIQMIELNSVEIQWKNLYFLYLFLFYQTHTYKNTVFNQNYKFKTIKLNSMKFKCRLTNRFGIKIVKFPHVIMAKNY